MRDATWTRAARIVMEHLHGRTFQSLADELKISPGRVQQIYAKALNVIGYRYAQEHPSVKWLHVWKTGKVPPEAVPEVGAILRRFTHPRRPDRDSPEGFVAFGEIRTGRRWED